MAQNTSLVSEVQSSVAGIPGVVIHEAESRVNVLAGSSQSAELVFDSLPDVGDSRHEHGVVEILAEGEYAHVADVTDAGYHAQIDENGHYARFSVERE